MLPTPMRIKKSLIASMHFKSACNTCSLIKPSLLAQSRMAISSCGSKQFVSSQDEYNASIPSSLYRAKMNIMPAFLHPFPPRLELEKSQLGHVFVTKAILWLASTRPKEGTEVLLGPASATFCKKIRWDNNC